MLDRHRSNISVALVQGIQGVFDFLWVIFTGMLAYRLRNGDLDLSNTYVISIWGVAWFNLNLLSYWGMYRTRPPGQLLVKHVKSISLAWAVSILALIIALFAFHRVNSVSRIWMALWVGMGLTGILLSRALLSHILTRLQRDGILGERAVIVGAGDIGRWLVKQLSLHTGGQIQVIGVFDDRQGRAILEAQKAEIKGNTDDLLEFVRQNSVSVIIIAIPSQAEERLDQLVSKLRVLPVEIHVCPGRIGFSLERSEVVEIGGVPLLRVVSRPLETWGKVIKRIEDIILSTVILLLITPLLLLIAVAIKLDSTGPVLFVQRRGGFNGRLFYMLKFRTMHPENRKPGAQLRQAYKGDPRITRVGRLLRHTSLDELPQFFNVLKGDMSIVGPRPHAIEHDQEFSSIIKNYVSRLRIKPGISGWAQIHGFRGLTDTREKLLLRIEYDLYYIDNWSLLLDLYIIAKTAISMVHANAR